MSEKVAIILFNLGGPDCKNSIRPFLLNFFMDKNIIAAPTPIRWFIANMIANRRTKNEAGESYGELGDKSPLLDNSIKQSKALDKVLNKNAGDNVKYKSFICMRYWHPMAPQVVRDVRDWGADKILILPLYPQFSTTTTWSSLEQWNKAMFEAGMETPTSTICCYPNNEGFISASAQNVKQKYEQALNDGHENIRVLFSAHGLPEKIVKGGDPYQWQCEETASKIAEKMGIENLDWQICYQSRVGPLKWIGPSLDEALDKAAMEKKSVVVFPHAFTQEHVETLVELDIEYREEAEKMGIEGYYRAETVATHPDFIDGLAKLVFKHTPKNGVYAEGEDVLCPSHFSRCCMRCGSPKP